MLRSILLISLIPACGLSDDTDDTTSDLEVLINEVYAKGDPDFIEIINTGDEAVPLTSLGFSDGDPAWTLTLDGALGPGELLDIPCDDGEAGVPFKLSSDGETLTMVAPSGATLDEVEFPSMSDGQSYGRLPDGGSQWQYLVPTPGEANEAGDTDTDPGDCTADPGDVAELIVFNELLSGGETVDFIELYNHGGQCVSLGGFLLTDDEEDLGAYAFPSGLELDPGEWTVVWCDKEAGADHADFKLSGDGEELYLSGPGEESVLHVELPALEDDTSWARIPDGSGDFTTSTAPTPGEANKAQ